MRCNYFSLDGNEYQAANQGGCVKRCRPITRWLAQKSADESIVPGYNALNNKVLGLGLQCLLK